MIMTFGTAMMLLLSFIAAILGLFVIETAFRIFRRWQCADEEERYELEKGFYLAYAVVCVVLGIRLFAVPLYFWTMQSLVPMIPGAMCLWGLFNALPTLCWPTLALKFLLPIIYGGWLILVRINNSCKKNPLMKNLMGLYVIISPLLLADCIIDLAIFYKLSPIQVTCCASAIDVWPRPLPALILGIAGQFLLLLSFFTLCITYATSTFLSASHKSFEWISRILSLILVMVTILTITEVMTPWILRLPLHHCPFCLLYKSPTTIFFVALFWYSITCPWWVLITEKMGRTDEEAKTVEDNFSKTLWTTSSLAIFIGLAIILVQLLLTLI